MMKKSILFMSAVAMFAAASCNKPELEGTENCPEAAANDFVAYMESTTRTALSEDGLTSEWQQGDKIAINGIPYIASQGGTRAVFTLEETADAEAEAPYVAGYPYSHVMEPVSERDRIVFAYLTSDEGGNVLTLPQNQIGSEVVAMAYSESERTLKFKNVLSLLKFEVPSAFGEDITQIKISTNEPLAGYITVDYNDGKPVVAENDGEVKEIVLEAEDGTFESGAAYYVGVLPGVKTNLTVTINEKVVATGIALEFKRNVIHYVGTLPSALPWAIAGTFNGWSTTANPMVKEGDYYVAKNVTGLHFTAQDSAGDKSSSTGFQFLNNGAWKGGYADTETPGKHAVNSWSWYWEDGGKNIYVDGAESSDKFDIYLNPVTKKFVIVAAGDAMPEDIPVPEWAVAGTFNGWSTTANPMVKEGDYYVARDITGLHFTAQDSAGDKSSSTGFQFLNNGAWKGGYADTETPGKHAVNSWSWYWDDGGKNIYVDGAKSSDEFDIYLNPVTKKFVIVAAGVDMPEDKPAEEPSTYSWGICGHMTSWGESPDIPMTLNDENEWFVAENVVVAADQAFKLRANGTWAVNRGAGGEVAPVTVTSGVEIEVYHDGQDMTVAAGTYNFYLSKDCDKFKVESVGVTPEVTPGETSEWAIIGDFNGSGTWVEKQMLTTVTSNVFVIEDVVVPTDYFSLLVKKFNDSTWSVKYGGGIIYFNPGNCMKVYQGGSDICITKAGTYDFYFDLANTMLYVVNPDVDYTSVSEQTVNGEEPKQEEPEVTANVLYFKPNSNWYNNSKRCSAYFFNSKGNTWVSMTETSTGSGVYEVNIPEGYTFGDNVIFCSMNKNTTANNWNNKWNQTADLVIPTDGKNLFTANNGWDSVNGTWSKR